MARQLPIGVVGPFSGLDLRRDAAMSDPGSLRVASNVSLLVGGNLARRDALVKICDVNAATVGLYAADGLLRVACPGGQSLQDTRPAEIWYDPVGNGAAYGLTSLADVSAVEIASSATGGKGYPYIVVERDNGRYEHHWLTEIPASAATAVDTLVDLPFDPGRTLVKSNGKLFCDDPSAGVIRFSATTTTPRDWTKARDAGFLTVRQFSAGSQDIRGLSYFKGYVAVLFQDSIQLWQMNADPARTVFISALNGPGTDEPRLTGNVLGDLFYFSRGGFRSLSRSLVTGDDLAEDIGAPIAELTKEATLADPVGFWSEARSQYIAANGTTVYVLTYSPSKDTTGWTTWTLPVAVEHIAENNGILYIRSGDTIYRFDPDAEADPTADVDFHVVTAFQHYGQPGLKKHWKDLDIVQTGDSAVNFGINPNDDTDLCLDSGMNTTDTTFNGGKLALNRVANSLCLDFTGDGIWRLDSAIIGARVLRGRA